MSDINIGSNYTLTENSNGNLEVIDDGGTPLLRHDNSADKLIALDPIEVVDLIDGADISHTGELADASDAVSDHGALAGLGDDDHTQYFHTDGRRKADRVDVDGPNSEAVETKTVSGSTTLDVSSNNAFRHTLSGDVDYSLSGGGAVLPGEAISLLIEQDGSTQYTTNWPSVNWDIDQGEPDDPQTGNLLEVVLRTFDGGATWYGSIAGRF